MGFVFLQLFLQLKPKSIANRILLVYRYWSLLPIATPSPQASGTRVTLLLSQRSPSAQTNTWSSWRSAWRTAWIVFALGPTLQSMGHMEPKTQPRSSWRARVEDYGTSLANWCLTLHSADITRLCLLCMDRRVNWSRCKIGGEHFNQIGTWQYIGVSSVCVWGMCINVSSIGH